MYYIIQIGKNELMERDSYKEMKREVNSYLKKKNRKQIMVNGIEITEPITKKNWNENT